MMELRTANDLNNMVPSPYSEFEPVRLPSPGIRGIPVGAETDTDSMGVDTAASR